MEGEGRCQGYKPDFIFIVKLRFHEKLLQHIHRCKWRTSELSIRQNLPRPIPVNSPQWHVLLPWRHHMMAIYLIAWKAQPNKGVSSLACQFPACRFTVQHCLGIESLLVKSVRGPFLQMKYNCFVCLQTAQIPQKAQSRSAVCLKTAVCRPSNH